MIIRPATARDIAAVHVIAAANPTAPQWTTAQFDDILHPDPGSTVARAVLLAEAHGTVIGFVVVSALSTVYPVQAELESIAVLPQYQGQGTGSALLRAAFDWCRGNDVAELRLEVRVSNTNAISLYKWAGFRMEGSRPNYYQRPAEDAMCMVRNTFPVEPLP